MKSKPAAKAPAKAAAAKKMGRPKKEISLKVFLELCKIQCTLNEIAGVFSVSPDTIERWCKDTFDETFADTYKKASAGGKSSIRRAQFRMAQTNATMAIWVGKQYLAQRDKQDVTSDDKPLFADKDRDEQIRLFMILAKITSREEGERVFDAIAAAEKEVERGTGYVQ